MEHQKKNMIEIYQTCFDKSNDIIDSIFNKGIFIVAPNDIEIGLSNETLEAIPNPDTDTLLL